jgi:hypothetical protein
MYLVMGVYPSNDPSPPFPRIAGNNWNIKNPKKDNPN